DSGARQADVRELLRARRVLVGPVGYAERHDSGVGRGRLYERRQRRAEAVDDGTVFDRDQELVTLGQRVEHLAIHRLEEARINDRSGDTIGGEQLRGLERRLAHHADRQDRAILALSEQLPRPIRNGRHFGGGRRLSGCLVARIAQRERSLVVLQGAAQQPDQLGGI